MICIREMVSHHLPQGILMSGWAVSILKCCLKDFSLFVPMKPTIQTRKKQPVMLLLLPAFV